MKVKDKPQTKHLGRNIARMRELLGIKQETLAEQIGISQQAISKIEQSEEVENGTLDKIAKALGVNSEAIKNFSEEAVINIISNTFHNSSADSSTLTMNYQPTFNTVEKIVELYERLLQAEREKVAMLEKMLNDGKKM